MLRPFSIRYLVDVRSNPYSRFQPAYNRKSLDLGCSTRRIRYLFMGDSLGGIPAELRGNAQRIDYELLKQRSEYQNGIKRLCNAVLQGHAVALMCSELQPEKCHRSKLLGTSLETAGVTVQHITEDGSLRKQATVLARLNQGQLTLFGEQFTSRAKY